MRLGTTVAVVLVIVLLWEIYLGFQRSRCRRDLYNLAKKRAIALGRPLVVIGDPDNGLWSRWMGRDYDEGDLTIDLTGCPTCRRGTAVRSSVEDFLPGLGSDSAVIFVSCVLEYVDRGHIDEVIKGLYRVAGSSENLFPVLVQPHCLTAYLYGLMGGEGQPKRVLWCSSGSSLRLNWWEFPWAGGGATKPQKGGRG